MGKRKFLNIKFLFRDFSLEISLVSQQYQYYWAEFEQVTKQVDEHVRRLGVGQHIDVWCVECIRLPASFVHKFEFT